MVRPEEPFSDPLDAFCKDTDAYLAGPEGRPLSDLKYAAKDIFDVAGFVTGGGNPDWKATHPPADQHAWIVETLLNAGATMVGKTHTDELTRGILGENAHYGTPINSRALGRVPGGSSSGSAAAVAGGLVDFALGSDTGGSVRIPASFCGLWGLRPTHDRIPLEGILKQASSYDTIGWFTRDAATYAQVAQVVFQTSIPDTSPTRIIIAQDLFNEADENVSAALLPIAEKIAAMVGSSTTVKLAPNGLAEWSAQQNVLQSKEAWDTVKDWVDQVNPRFSFWVSERYQFAINLTDAQIDEAAAVRDSLRIRMDEVFADGGFLCLPTAVVPAPLRGLPASAKKDIQSRLSRLTCIAGTTGRPQLSMPLGEVNGMPVGISIMGDRGSDEQLINFACRVEAEFGS
ncbi:MAG: amidase [Dehalococcoidia bacterium]|nr:amidase [Dehalococcoidia bacterium]|tara:strand:+ start:279 stop:1481 length:1203 start_codon:yes stop_codon:yes gene_type:complete